MKTKRILTLAFLITLAAICFSMQIFAEEFIAGDMNGDGRVDSDAQFTCCVTQCDLKSIRSTNRVI